MADLTDAESAAIATALTCRGDVYAVMADLLAAARADERDLRRVLSAYAPGWDGTLPHLVQILSSWPVAQYEADRIRAALDQPRNTPAQTEEADRG